MLLRIKGCFFPWLKDKEVNVPVHNCLIMMIIQKQVWPGYLNQLNETPNQKWVAWNVHNNLKNVNTYNWISVDKSWAKKSVHKL